MNNQNPTPLLYPKYVDDIQKRSRLHYFLGLISRWKLHLKYQYASFVARRNGATIGIGVTMPLSLAKKANKNLVIGSHTSIGTDKLDLRNPITIGNHVIIGAYSQIITASHNVDSPEWNYKGYGIVIADYTWIAQNVIILPSCRKIERGAVIGTGSVVVKNVQEMSILSGNPAKEIRKRKCVHDQFVVESCRAGDFNLYKAARKMKNNI